MIALNRKALIFARRQAPAPVKPKPPAPQEHDSRLHRHQERGARLDLYFMNGADAAESET